jgi:hypothetical protein
VSVVNFIFVVFIPLIFLLFNVHISQPYKRDGVAKILYILSTESVFGLSFRIRNICRNLLIFEVMIFAVRVKF